MTMAPMVEFQDVWKSFGSVKVLQGLNLRVSRGEKLAIIGASGSGKTTLLRLLMTLEKPDDGLIRVDGEPLWHEQSHNDSLKPASARHLRQMRGKIGMVFQQFNLFPHMSAVRNVSLAPTLVMGQSDEEARRLALELLETVGLADKVDAYPSQLSGGQKQRVAIARALAMKPKLMLFDEVTSALDPELVGEVLGVIRDLAHRHDMTMMIVTHEMTFARDVADRVIFMDKGVVVEENSPDIMFSNPANERTRQFLRAILQR